MDFYFESLIQEAFLISYQSKGGFTFDNVCEMPFDLYEITLREAMRIQSDTNNFEEYE